MEWMASPGACNEGPEGTHAGVGWRSLCTAIRRVQGATATRRFLGSATPWKALLASVAVARIGDKLMLSTSPTDGPMVLGAGQMLDVFQRRDGWDGPSSSLAGQHLSEPWCAPTEAMPPIVTEARRSLHPYSPRYASLGSAAGRHRHRWVGFRSDTNGAIPAWG